MSETVRLKLKVIFLDIFPDIDENDFDLKRDRSEFSDWDSLTHMQLISEIESVFSLTFEMEEVVEVNSAEDLLKLIKKKQS